MQSSGWTAVSERVVRPSTTGVAVVGIGRTAHTRPRVTERSSLALGAGAVRDAIADAGLRPRDIDEVGSFDFAKLRA